MGETRLGQGRERARAYLNDNPEVASTLRERVLSARTPVAEA